MNNSSAASSLDACGRTQPPGDPLSPPEFPAGYIECVFYPLLLLICTLGNILNLLVLSNNRPKCTADVYLMALAVSDLAILWAYLPPWIKKIKPSLVSAPPADFVAFDRIYRGLYPSLMSGFYFFSNWVVVVFSLERLLVVSRPMYFLGRFNVRTAALAVAVLVVGGILKSLQVFLDYFFWLSTGERSNKWVAIRAVKFSWLANWAPIQAVATVVDPIVCFFFLLVINIILAQQLIKRHRSRKKDLQTGQTPSNRDDCTRTIILSIGCALLFLICKIPSLTYNALLVANRPPFCTFMMTNKATPYWLEFVWLFNNVNYSVNFYLYCAISQKFRQQLKARFPALQSKWRKWRVLKKSENTVPAGANREGVPVIECSSTRKASVDTATTDTGKDSRN